MAALAFRSAGRLMELIQTVALSGYQVRKRINDFGYLAMTPLTKWREQYEFTRPQAYAILSGLYGEEVHFGELDAEGCRRVIRLIEDYVPPDDNH